MADVRASAPRHTGLEALTGLRFLLALGVFWFHFSAAWPIAALDRVRRGGGIGVYVFFILSGFVLAHVYASRGRLVKSTFWALRFGRVYPLYFVGLVASIALAVVDGRAWTHAKTTATALHLLMLQSWWEAYRLFWNRPAWTISTEAFFYLLFPWLLVALLRFTSPRSLLLALGAVGASIAAVMYLSDVPLVGTLWVKPLGGVPFFVVGLLLGRLYALDLAAARRFAPLFILVGAAGFIAAMALAGEIDSTGASVRAFAVTLFPGALLVFGLASSDGLVARLLSSRVFVLLGEASYALYILQEPASRWWSRAFGIADTAFGLARFCAFFGFMIVLSIACYSLIETPIRSAVRRWVSRLHTGA